MSRINRINEEVVDEEIDIQKYYDSAIEICDKSKTICEYSTHLCGYIIICNLGLYLTFTLFLMKQNGNLDKFETELYNKVYELIWRLLRVYSLINLKFKKYVTTPLNYTKHKVYTNIKTYLFNEPYKYILVRDGEEIMKFKKINQLISYYLFTKNAENDDLICYRDDENIYYSKIKDFIYGGNVVDNDNYDTNVQSIKKSSIKFMMCNIDINIKNKNLLLHRELNIDNFMLVGNKILTKSFVMWYCNKYLDLDNELIESYKVNIIDQDVDHIEIDANSFIEIDRDEYLIHKKRHTLNVNIHKDEDEDTPVNELDKVITNYYVSDESSEHNESDDDSSTTNHKDDDSINNDECNSNGHDDNDDDLCKRKCYENIDNNDDNCGSEHSNSSGEEECKYHRDLENDMEQFNESINNLSSSWMPSFMLF
jgi:hypothetical protein